MKKLNFLTHLVSFSIAALAFQLFCPTARGDWQTEFTVSYPGGVIQAQEQFVYGSPYDSANLFVRSLNNSGVVLWENYVGWGNGFYFYDFDVDREGNMFITGYVPRWMAFGGTEDDLHITIYNPNPEPMLALFALVVVKLAPDGSALWVNQVWWPNWECSTELELDAAGNAYLIWTDNAGPNCRVSAVSGEIELARPAAGSTVLARFSPSGALDWLVQDENPFGSQLTVKKHRISVVLGEDRVEFNDAGKLITRKRIN
jgi:hypothetical protein